MFGFFFGGWFLIYLQSVEAIIDVIDVEFAIPSGQGQVNGGC